ncbi:MAG: hypothetical protein FVQ84_22170 [Planctomycetes bacterium]|nr:hypothetical protein [Planctomycetota bacterium]
MYSGLALIEREQARCEHRTISIFCAIQCWINGWNGIRINRDQLKLLLDRKRLKDARIKWIKQDFEELFPFQRPDDLYYWFEFSRRTFDDQPVINDCIIPEQPISDNRIGFLLKRYLPTFNEAILDIFTSDNET